MKIRSKLAENLQLLFLFPEIPRILFGYNSRLGIAHGRFNILCKKQKL